MEPAESSPTDEFVSGQNLRFGIAEPPRCDSSVRADATQQFKGDALPKRFTASTSTVEVR